MGFSARSMNSTRQNPQIQHELIGKYRKHIEKKQREDDESF